MKKLRVILGSFTLIALLALLTACPKPSPDNPTITVTQDIDSVVLGVETVVTFTVAVNPDVTNGSKITKLEIVAPDTAQNFMKDDYDSESTVNHIYEYTVAADVEVGELNFTFTGYDDQDNSVVEGTLFITVAETVPIYAVIVEWTGSLEYSSTSLTNTMMLVCDADGGTTGGGTETNADLAFVWQTTYGYSVVSPDAAWIAELYSYNGITYTTADKNNTQIMLYTGGLAWADFTAEIIDGLEITTSTVTGGGNGVQSVNTGDILVFNTADGQKGAFLVTSNSKVTKNMAGEAKYQSEGSSSK